MSAIKRFFSSHKTTSNSKLNHIQQHESQTSQTKLSNTTSVAVEKLPVVNGTVENEETKENMVSPPFPSSEIMLKYLIET